MLFFEKLAIVIPVWKKELTKFEEISFRQCCLILKKHPFIIVTWKDLDISNYLYFLQNECVKYRIFIFDRSFFLSTNTYNKLMISLFFYIKFIKYQYILIYQLDCFVFKDNLSYWIECNYSYIGAPWVNGYSQTQYGNQVIGVGNGGLSLRKVKDHLTVLLSFRYINRDIRFYAESNKKKYLYKYFISNNTFFLFNNYSKNEDIFWSNVAAKKFFWFKVPKWEIASLFSVEVQPKYFFDINKKIPFGCHAWWTYDIDFWKPYIEKFGYKIP